MGFNKRKLEDQRRETADKEATNRRSTDALVALDAKRSGSLAMLSATRHASSFTQCEVQKVRRPYSGAAGLSFPVAARLRLVAASEFVSR